MAFEDFFKKRDSSVSLGPKAKLMETPWGHEGMSSLRDMLGTEAPKLDVAEMSDEETQGMEILQSILKGEAFQDPRTSPFWQGLRQASMAEEEKGVAAINRESQLGGMGTSSTAARTRGDYRSDMATGRTTMLGSLYEKERDRDNLYTRAGMAFKYGGLPRSIENEKNQADYQQKAGTIDMNSQISQLLMNYQPWHQREWWVNPEKPSRFSQAIQGAMKGYEQTGHWAGAVAGGVAGGTS